MKLLASVLILLFSLNACVDTGFTEEITIHVKNLTSSEKDVWFFATDDTRNFDSLKLIVDTYDSTTYLWTTRLKEGSFKVRVEEREKSVGPYFTNGVLPDDSEIWLTVYADSLKFGNSNY